MVIKVLELFSGSGSVGKVCKEKGWEVLSLDLDGKADINIDILKWDYKKDYKPGDFDIIHASPPCHTFSNLRRTWIGRKLKAHGDTIITREILDKDMEDKGVPLLRKAEEIIEYFKPKYYIIENPQGKMKNYMKKHKHYIVDYCMYSDWGYKKPTYFWTNIEGFKPKRCNRKCGNMEGTRHKKSIGGGTHNTPTTLQERYRIPPDLIKGLFDCCIIKDE